MWMPGFNMTASSIKSEQSVRVSKEPVMQTPVQYNNKINDDRPLNIGLHNSAVKNLDYTPDNYQNKPKMFGNGSMNPSMTAHSMKVGPSHMNSKTLAHSRSPGSQVDNYEDNQSVSNTVSMGEYSVPGMPKMMPNQYASEKAIVGHESGLPSKGPIKPIPFNGISSNTSDALPGGGYNNFDDDDVSESRQHRYSQNTNKSLESRNRAKNSLSQKKPPVRNKKIKSELKERALSIDNRSNDDVSEKYLSPEAEWKNILTDLQKKTDWERQFKASNTIKEFSETHQQFFKTSDPYFSEIMAELSNL